ncbi:hypothetical protein AB0I39_07615 [Kitasatospora purpeofusca]|uniref:hypothetical protein n=1 Tax=Kitasatospora purpeofusca TaxID=67352 RepID=UPI0033D133FD
MSLMVVADPVGAGRLRERVVEVARSWGLGLDADAEHMLRVVVSNTFAASLRPWIRSSGQVFEVRLILVGRRLTVEVRTGSGAFGHERPRTAARLPTLLALHTVDTGVEQRFHATRVWATTELPAAPRPRGRGRPQHRSRRPWLLRAFA